MDQKTRPGRGRPQSKCAVSPRACSEAGRGFRTQVSANLELIHFSPALRRLTFQLARGGFRLASSYFPTCAGWFPTCVELVSNLPTCAGCFPTCVELLPNLRGVFSNLRRVTFQLARGVFRLVPSYFSKLAGSREDSAQVTCKKLASRGFDLRRVARQLENEGFRSANVNPGIIVPRRHARCIRRARCKELKAL